MERVPTTRPAEQSHLEIDPIYSDGAIVFRHICFQPSRQCHSGIGCLQGPGDAIPDEHPVDQPERVEPSPHHNLHTVHGSGKFLSVVLDIWRYLV